MNCSLCETPVQVPVVLPPAPSKRTPPPRREKVLVVLHSDGWVEVYAERHIDVKVVQKLHTIDESAEMATLLDEYIETTIPKCYRDLYVPVKLRAQDQCRLITADQAADTLLDLYYLRELQKLDNEVLIVSAGEETDR